MPDKHHVERRVTYPADPQPREGSIVQRAMPIYVALLFAILTVLGILILIRLIDVLLLLFISVLFAAAISGPAERLERLHIPRAIAALLIYVIVFGGFVAVLWFVVPTLLDQLATLADEPSDITDRYSEIRDRYNELREQYPALGSFDSQIEGFQSRIIEGVGERLIDLPSRVFGAFLNMLAVFTISMMLITSRERLLGLIVSLVSPRYRDQTRNVLTKMWGRVGYYLRAKFIVMLIVGTITYFTLLLIGVPFALLLAILVAIGELIPRVGPWLARIPLLGIAALEDWTTLALTFAASVVIENAKGFLISPYVEGDQLDIHPLLVFVSVLVGAALFGPAGAFVAVPAAAMVQVVFEEVVLPWRRTQLTGMDTPGTSSDPS